MGVTLGIVTAHAGTAVLDGYTGAREQIIGYYAANAREGGGNCGAGHIAAIGDALAGAGQWQLLWSWRSTTPTAPGRTPVRPATAAAWPHASSRSPRAALGYTVTAMSGQEP